MIPAFGMVILPQNPSTGNGKVPGCSCILSVAITDDAVLACAGDRAHAGGAVPGRCGDLGGTLGGRERYARTVALSAHPS